MAHSRTERQSSPSIHDKSHPQPNGIPRLPKRLTLNGPILQPAPQLEHPQSSSPSQTAPTDPIRTSLRPPTISAFPTGFTTFLTSLAAQERRVLELREELHKAEADLSQLKQQWAVQKAGRNRNELRQVERLQSLPINSPAVVEGQSENGATPAAALRASLENGTDRPVIRKSTQRVFSGSRHTRALSLLSPGATSHQPAQPRPFEQVLSPTVTTTYIHSSQPPMSRSSTMCSAEQNIGFARTYKQLAARQSMPSPTKDVILNGGKKMASDLREGLWTFFEDMRQATVGEEGIHGTATRAIGSGRGQRRGPRRLQISEQERNGEGTKSEKRVEGPKGKVSIMARDETETPSDDPIKEKSFWSEFGLETPSKKTTSVVSAGKQQNSETDVSHVDIDDSWDIWDSPIPPQHSPKHVESGQLTSQNKNDGLPWPDLRNLTPRLSRTVSDMMKEWDSPAVTARTSPAGLQDQAVASPHM